MKDKNHYRDVAERFYRTKSSPAGGRQGHEYLLHNMELHNKMVDAIDKDDESMARRCEKDICMISGCH